MELISSGKEQWIAQMREKFKASGGGYCPILRRFSKSCKVCIGALQDCTKRYTFFGYGIIFFLTRKYIRLLFFYRNSEVKCLFSLGLGRTLIGYFCDPPTPYNIFFSPVSLTWEYHEHLSCQWWCHNANFVFVITLLYIFESDSYLP